MCNFIQYKNTNCLAPSINSVALGENATAGIKNYYIDRMSSYHNANTMFWVHLTTDVNFEALLIFDTNASINMFEVSLYVVENILI